jgi:hypothetical protein
MKNFTVSIFILLCSLSYSQSPEKGSLTQHRIDNPISVQVGLQGSIFTSLDDNFINQAYAKNIGFNLVGRFGIKEFVGIGLNYNRYEFKLDDSRFFGSNFPTSRFHSFMIFAYYQQSIYKNLTAELKFGIFDSTIKNRGTLRIGDLTYNLSGVITGLNMIYYLSDKKVIGISFGANVHFSLSETIETAPAEQNFINKNMFSTLNLGIVIGN